MKRAAQRLPDISSGFRHTFRRYKTGGQTTTSRAPARFSKGRQYGPQVTQEDYPISKTLREVLSPEACGWLEGKPYKPKVDYLAKEELLQSPSLPPSQERQLFDSLATPEETITSSSGDADAYIDESQRIPAGTLVEIRRSDAPMHGVVLYNILLGRRWLVHCLTVTGELWACHEHDITFQIPDFVSKQTAEQCGVFEVVRSESEQATRADVLFKLRSFDKRFEYACHTIPEIARSISFYDQVAHPDPNTWAYITTQQAAEKLLGKSANLTREDFFAVQTYLFSQGEQFAAETRRFLQKQAFWVRPRQELADIEAVTDMVIRAHPALNTFAEKARRIITASRQRSVESFGEPPSKRSLGGVEWTEVDLTIIRFFLASMHTRRIIQKDPFEVPVAHILKLLKMYSSELYDQAVAHIFLMDLGIVAPWEDVNTRIEHQREETSNIDLTPTKSTPLLPTPLGPKELYPQDIVDSIRHDFGDMAVYVIDDWGAEELDDGVSIERIPSDPEHNWLHVHVADPTTLLPPTHEIARNAMRLAAAHYRAERTIPMLPGEVGFHRFSLGSIPGQPDFTLTFSMKVNATGDIVDYKIRPSLVRNVRRMKYDEVDAFLGSPIVAKQYPFGGRSERGPITSPTVDPTTLENLQLIKDVTRRLDEGRSRNGALVFSFSQAEMLLEPRPFPENLMGELAPSEFRGFPKLTYTVASMLDTGSRSMVAECMKGAGRIASLFFRDRGIPALRRSVGHLQTEIRGKIAEVLASRQPGGIVDAYEALRARITVPPGQYLTTPAMHSLLGIPEGEGYVKVTSPLRRFGDMVAHWQIKHALLAEKGDRASPVLFDEDWLLRMADDLAQRELNVRRSENVQTMYWAHMFLLRWMNDPARDRSAHDPLRSLTARVTETPVENVRKRELNCQVHIPDLALNGRVIGLPLESSKTMDMGDHLEVEIVNVGLGTRPVLDLKLKGQ